MERRYKMSKMGWFEVVRVTQAYISMKWPKSPVYILLQWPAIVVPVDTRRQVKYLLRYDADLDVNLPFGAFAAAMKSTSAVDRQHHAATSTVCEGDGYRYEGLTPLSVAAQLTTVDVLDIIRLLQKHGRRLIDLRVFVSYQLVNFKRRKNRLVSSTFRSPI